MRTSFIGFLFVLAMTACSQEKVSFNTLETARNQARENAIWNAQRFRMVDIRFKDSDIVPRGDSTQDINCPQGDGWATVSFIIKGSNQMIDAKCSTVSPSVGCMTDEDFKAKRYAQEDGHCQSTDKVPFPIPKIHE